jgi:hypothetical protein
MPQELIKPFADQAARTSRNVNIGTVALTVAIQTVVSAWAAKFRHRPSPYVGRAKPE